MAVQSEIPLNYLQGPVIGIETSCDETSVGIVTGKTVLANVISSQSEKHREWGGVVPEAAARMHAELFLPVLKSALQEADISLHDLVGIGVTNRPGLVGALSVGLSGAKALACALKIPFIGVNHLEAHILSPFIDSSFTHPHVCLLVSGGHTELILVRRPGEYSKLGGTIDDAAGEAFDKAARTLGLGYPGGPAIEKAAVGGDPDKYPLPRGLREPTFDFSFAGIKTAVARTVEQYAENLDISSLAASFQTAVTSVLAERTLAAARESAVEQITLVGGVASNNELRNRMAQLASKQNIQVTIPHHRLCTDNGAMIAHAASWRIAIGELSSLDLEASAKSPLP